MSQAVASRIRPLDEEIVMVGRARTAAFMEVYHHEAGTNPYELEIALIDSLEEDDVAVLACPPKSRIAPWGELLTTASRARGAAGCVTDGMVRDVRLIREMRFPVFSGAIGPLDSKGRGEVKAIDVPVECGGVPVAPGDWIFGDVDGVVVIPEKLCAETIELSLKKASAENTVRAELAAGEPLATVFARHGIL
jgi:regulator of RNase E activity RraA